jgi:16S rRNA (cytosine1402-N4)-methyltransferase
MILLIRIESIGIKSKKIINRIISPILYNNIHNKYIDREEYDYHLPVMLNECCNNLCIKEDGIYVDCTMGGGGHTKEILERGGNVIGLDQDPDAIAKTSSKLSKYIESGKLEIIQTNFRFIEDAIKKSKIISMKMKETKLVDGVLMDLGISSHQIDEPSRGFSFGGDGPLDMRMGKGIDDSNSITAASIVNEWDLTSIANVLYQYGEETRSRQIAREIVASRPINTTGELEKIISRITIFKKRPQTLARCFQALRIAVNDEMGALIEALTSLENCVRPGGRLVVLSYHSLEDRKVKQLIRDGKIKLDSTSSTIITNNNNENILPWQAIYKRAQIPSEEELNRNRRSRSAKLRVAERVTEKMKENDNISKTTKKSFLGSKQLAKLKALENENNNIE